MMKVKSIHIAISIALLSMTFVSCNEDTLYTGPCKVRFVAEVQDEVSVTRADEDKYSTFSPSDFNAGLFVSYETTTGTPTAPGYSVSWNGSALSTSLALETGDYKFYGYAPQQDGAKFDITYKTLTIPDIPGLSSTDMLVIKPCSTKVEPTDIGKDKIVSLQMDHLMAKITPYFYINSEYNNLRDIHIKSVTFSLDDDAKTFTASVVYNDNNLSYQTSWKGSENLNANTIEFYKDNNNEATFLSTTSSNAYGQCYIVPGQDISNLKMTVKYDVYDKKMQKVRSGEEAENTVKIKVRGTTLNNLDAGNNYKLNIQIIPTYLYVLSDNDESSVLVIPNN